MLKYIYSLIISKQGYDKNTYQVIQAVAPII